MGRLTDQLERREGVRKIFMDLPEDLAAPKRGEFIVTDTKVKAPTWYQILTARKVKRRDPQALPRYTMLVKITEPPSVMPPFAHVLTWYPRKKKTCVRL